MSFKAHARVFSDVVVAEFVPCMIINAIGIPVWFLYVHCVGNLVSALGADFA